MDQPFQGFQANQQMGLFTFYRMQEPLIRNQQKLPAIDMKNAKSKLISTPKIIERDQNIQPAAKRRVQSVADCRKKDDQSICKRAVNRYAKLQNKKLSEMAGQQKHSIIDFSFDFSPKIRKNAGKQLFQSTISHRLKTTNPESIKEEAQLFEIQESHYFHSVNLIKINQIKKEQMIELFQSQKDKDDYKKLKIKHKAEFQKPMTLNKQQIEDNYAGQMSFLKNLKKEKPETLNFLQFLQQKKKKMTEQYKKVRLNKKISDILKIKVNQQCPVKLKRVGFDRSQISYLIPNVNYPVCQ